MIFYHGDSIFDKSISFCEIMVAKMLDETFSVAIKIFRERHLFGLGDLLHYNHWVLVHVRWSTIH